MGNFRNEASNDFSKARSKARIESLLATLQMKNSDLLSFYDVKEMVHPKQETYKGVQAIPVAKIIGSEGRYQDFNRTFLPKKEMLRNRWQSIDEAHLKYVTLPPISVFKIGEAYFVRDGNHRVSVAKSRGIDFIDAEVVELNSQITPKPGMTNKQLRKLVVDYERQRFIDQTGLDTVLDMTKINFSVPGRYTEMLHHIEVHKYYINMEKEEEIPLRIAAKSWFDNVYMPIYSVIKSEKMLTKFPGRTYGDLYMWMVKYWGVLKEKEGDSVSAEQASRDYTKKYGKAKRKQFIDWLKKKFGIGKT